MIRVKKRDGRIVPFDGIKIKNTIQKAFKAAGVENDFNATGYVLAKLNKYIILEYSEDNRPIDIEEVLDIVEDILMDFDKATAKAFIKERFYKEMEHRIFHILVDSEVSV